METFQSFYGIIVLVNFFQLGICDLTCRCYFSCNLVVVLSFVLCGGSVCFFLFIHLYAILPQHWSSLKCWYFSSVCLFLYAGCCISVPLLLNLLLVLLVGVLSLLLYIWMLGFVLLHLTAWIACEGLTVDFGWDAGLTIVFGSGCVPPQWLYWSAKKKISDCITVLTDNCISPFDAVFLWKTMDIGQNWLATFDRPVKAGCHSCILAITARFGGVSYSWIHQEEVKLYDGWERAWKGRGDIMTMLFLSWARNIS